MIKMQQAFIIILEWNEKKNWKSQQIETFAKEIRYKESQNENFKTKNTGTKLKTVNELQYRMQVTKVRINNLEDKTMKITKHEQR